MNWKEIEQAYITGQIDAAEKNRLSALIQDKSTQNEMNLSDDLDSIMAAGQGVHSSDLVDKVGQHIDDEVAQKIKATIAQQRGKKKSIIRPLYLFASAAAAIALLVIVPMISGVGSDKLFDKYSSGENMPSLIERSGEMGLGSKIELAYVNQNYEEAISLFKDHDEASTHSGILIFTAMSYAHQGQYLEANRTIDLLLNNDELTDAPKGHLYKGLIALKQGKEKQAKSIFESVIKNDFPGKEEATEILKKLK